jgi:hypothetical protein
MFLIRISPTSNDSYNTRLNFEISFPMETSARNSNHTLVCDLLQQPRLRLIFRIIQEAAQFTNKLVVGALVMSVFIPVFLRNTWELLIRSFRCFEGRGFRIVQRSSDNQSRKAVVCPSFALWDLFKTAITVFGLNSL